jgi:hypothetical protein
MRPSVKFVGLLALLGLGAFPQPGASASDRVVSGDRRDAALAVQAQTARTVEAWRLRYASCPDKVDALTFVYAKGLVLALPQEFATLGLGGDGTTTELTPGLIPKFEPTPVAGVLMGSSQSFVEGWQALVDEGAQGRETLQVGWSLIRGEFATSSPSGRNIPFAVFLSSSGYVMLRGAIAPLWSEVWRCSVALSGYSTAR